MDKLTDQIKQIAKASKCVASDLLVEFDRTINAIGDMKSVSLACHPQGPEIINEIKDAQERRRMKEAIKLLKKKRLIRIEKTANRMTLSLTNKGMIESIRHQVINEYNKLPEDGVCVVVFDIPEHVRKIRNELRRFLKKAGFTQLQRSVWVTNKNVVNPLRELIRSMKAKKWIHVFHGRSII